MIELLINKPVPTNSGFMIDSPLPKVPPCMRVRFLLSVDWTFTMLNERKETISL